jgi:hypothetical protein
MNYDSKYTGEEVDNLLDEVSREDFEAIANRLQEVENKLTEDPEEDEELAQLKEYVSSIKDIISVEDEGKIIKFNTPVYSVSSITARGKSTTEEGDDPEDIVKIALLEDWGSYNAETSKSTALSAYLGYNMYQYLMTDIYPVCKNIENTIEQVLSKEGGIVRQLEDDVEDLSKAQANIKTELSNVPTKTSLDDILKGYVTSTGTAADSNKLGGQNATYYATADAVTQLIERLNTLIDKLNTEYSKTTSIEQMISDFYNEMVEPNYLKINSDGSVTIKHKIIVTDDKGQNPVEIEYVDGNLKVSGSMYSPGSITARKAN